MASGLKIVWPIPDPISEVRAERPAFAQYGLSERVKSEGSRWRTAGSSSERGAAERG
jgi:hypothetical protein